MRQKKKKYMKAGNRNERRKPNIKIKRRWEKKKKRTNKEKIKRTLKKINIWWHRVPENVFWEAKHRVPKKNI